MQISAKDQNVSLSRDIFPAEAWEMITQEKGDDNLVVLDVSAPDEFSHLHLKDAINVNLMSRFFKARMDIMDRDKTYLVYCKVGGRSKIAQKIMQRMGFENVYNIVGGTLLWEEERLPFAPETEGVNKFSFCPIFVSIVLTKRIKRILKGFMSHLFPHKDAKESLKQKSRMSITAQ